jgi:hypothetical protein
VNRLPKFSIWEGAAILVDQFQLSGTAELMSLLMGLVYAPLRDGTQQIGAVTEVTG